MQSHLMISSLLLLPYQIIESAVQTLSTEDKLSHIEARQRGQLYTALKNAFTTIVRYLSELSIELKESPGLMDVMANR